MSTVYLNLSQPAEGSAASPKACHCDSCAGVGAGAGAAEAAEAAEVGACEAAEARWILKKRDTDFSTVGKIEALSCLQKTY